MPTRIFKLPQIEYEISTKERKMKGNRTLWRVDKAGADKRKVCTRVRPLWPDSLGGRRALGLASPVQEWLMISEVENWNPKDLFFVKSWRWPACRVETCSLLKSTIHNKRLLCSTYHYLSFNSEILMHTFRFDLNIHMSQAPHSIAAIICWSLC